MFGVVLVPWAAWKFVPFEVVKTRVPVTSSGTLGTAFWLLNLKEKMLPFIAAVRVPRRHHVFAVVGRVYVLMLEGPAFPVSPLAPAAPTAPSWPLGPVQPVSPVKPTPLNPFCPGAPVQPVLPVSPFAP